MLPLGTAFIWPKPQGLSRQHITLLAQTHRSLFESSISKSLARRKPSPIIVSWCCGWIGGLGKVCYQPFPIIHPQFQLTTAPAESGCCHLHLQFFGACECSIVNGPLLTVLFSSDQQGSINERPLTRSQLWLSEHCTACPSNTQLYLPDNCVIRVCINNWSTKRDMHYSPVCLIC